ncbi:hypothetical protein G4B88_013455, partial [Cannabis sativa]
MGFEGQCFTCLNKRQGAAHVQERLDRYFCNQDWHNLFPSVKVINGDFIHSDHRPIAAILENVARRAWNKTKFGSIPKLVRETQKQLDDLLSVAAPLVRMDEGGSWEKRAPGLSLGGSRWKLKGLRRRGSKSQ